jgi:ribose 5-phosphate isomerase B
MKNKKLYIAADHAGYSFKQLLVKYIQEELKEFTLEDLGCQSSESVNYPDFAFKLSEKVAKENAAGILICGSGIGMSIAANKVNGIRAALVWDMTSARLSREHNNSNVLCLGARLIGEQTAKDCIKVWLNTEFLKGRHENRLELIHKRESHD